jgi:hypothetical protein
MVYDCRQIMNPQQHEHSRSSSPYLTLLSTKSPDTTSSNYLTLPNSNSSNRIVYLRKHNCRLRNSTDRLLYYWELSARGSIPVLLKPLQATVFNFDSSPARVSGSIPLSERHYMSVYSSSSVETDLSEFSNPPARTYRTRNPYKMPRKISAVSLLVRRIYLGFQY